MFVLLRLFEITLKLIGHRHLQLPIDCSFGVKESSVEIYDKMLEKATILVHSVLIFKIRRAGACYGRLSLVIVT